MTNYFSSTARIAALDAEGPLALGPGDQSAYNVSTGMETSVNQLFGSLRLASGFSGDVEYAEARDGDVLRSSLDPTKAARTFGWRAHQTLDLGAEMTWRWYASQA